MNSVNVRTSAESSANTFAAHTPSSSQSRGSVITQTTCNTSVRMNDMIAETSPLLSAVKNAEPKILKPITEKMNAQIKKPRRVFARSSGLPPTKLYGRGYLCAS